MSKKPRAHRVKNENENKNKSDSPDEKFRHNVVVNAKTKGQKRYIQDIQNNDITICMGPAGTGKTAIAVGLGLQAIFDKSSGIDHMVILRPVREACDENIGFLPGTLEEKMTPWAAPVVDNMKVFIDSQQIHNLFTYKKVEIVPLALARGRSFNRAYILLDEAQNCSADQFLMVLTRLGENSKMVINGDTSQSDHPAEGLSDACERLQGMRKVAIASMGTEDIVRNPLISEIIKRYTRTDQGYSQIPAE